MNYMNLTFDDIDWDSNVYFIEHYSISGSDHYTIELRELNINSELEPLCVEEVYGVIDNSGITASLQYQIITPCMQSMNSWWQPVGSIFRINDTVGLLTNRDNAHGVNVDIRRINDSYVISIMVDDDSETRSVSLIVDTKYRTEEITNVLNRHALALSVINDMVYKPPETLFDVLEYDHRMVTGKCMNSTNTTDTIINLSVRDTLTTSLINKVEALGGTVSQENETRILAFIAIPYHDDIDLLRECYNKVYGLMKIHNITIGSVVIS